MATTSIVDGIANRLVAIYEQAHAPLGTFLIVSTAISKHNEPVQQSCCTLFAFE